MIRLNALLSTSRGQFVAVVAELALFGCVALLGRHALHRARAAHAARAQSQRECSPGVNACARGATCEVVNGVGRCAGEFEDAQSLWQEAHEWVGRRVVIRHAEVEVDRGSYGCTERACADGCCNYCWGRARLVNAGQFELVGVDCGARECEVPECGISEHQTFWVLQGDIEIHAEVREASGTFALGRFSVRGHVGTERDIYGRPLE